MNTRNCYTQNSSFKAKNAKKQPKSLFMYLVEEEDQKEEEDINLIEFSDELTPIPISPVEEPKVAQAEKPKKNEQNRYKKNAEEGKIPFFSEMKRYEVPTKMYTTSIVNFVEPSYPSLPPKTIKMFDMEGNNFVIKPEQVKTFIYNLFLSMKAQEAFEQVGHAIDQFYALCKRTFSLKLDYQLPDIDTALMNDIMTAKFESRNDEIPFMRIPATDFAMSFNNERNERFTNEKLYIMYRSFIPIIDYSNEKFDFVKKPVMKAYYNMYRAYAKDTYYTKAQTGAQQEIIKILTLISNLLDIFRPGSFEYWLTVSVLGLGLTSIWTALMDNIPCLTEEDYYFFDIEEIGHIPYEDYEAFCEELKDRDWHGASNPGLHEFIIRILELNSEFAEGIITIYQYDSQYRGLVLDFICDRYAKDAIKQKAEQKKAEDIKLEPVKQVRRIINTLVKPTQKGKAITLSEKRINELLACDTNIVVDQLIDQFNKFELAGSFLFGLIDKYYKDNEYFINSIHNLNYSYGAPNADVSLANLFKLAIFFNDSELFDFFKEKAATYSEQAKQPEYFALADVYVHIINDINVNLYTVFCKRQPKFSVEYIRRGLNFYSYRRAQQEKATKYRVAYMELHESFIIKRSVKPTDKTNQ